MMAKYTHAETFKDKVEDLRPLYAVLGRFLDQTDALQDVGDVIDPSLLFNSQVVRSLKDGKKQIPP